MLHGSCFSKIFWESSSYGTHPGIVQIFFPGILSWISPSGLLQGLPQDSFNDSSRDFVIDFSRIPKEILSYILLISPKIPSSVGFVIPAEDALGVLARHSTGVPPSILFGIPPGILLVTPPRIHIEIRPGTGIPFEILSGLFLGITSGISSGNPHGMPS